MGNRHQSREAALGFLYQLDLQVGSTTETPTAFIKHFQVPMPFQTYFLKLTEGVLSTTDVLDREIEDAAENWKLYRINKLDKAILRMACWELLFENETPVKVILDEAVEIAKSYETNESAAFVNGLLDKIAKKTREAELAAS